MQFVKTPLYNMHDRIKQGVRTVDSLHLKLNRYYDAYCVNHCDLLKGPFS